MIRRMIKRRDAESSATRPRRPLVEQAPDTPSGDGWWIAVTRTTNAVHSNGRANFGSNHPVRVMTAHPRFRNSPTHPDGFGDAAIQE